MTTLENIKLTLHKVTFEPESGSVWETNFSTSAGSYILGKGDAFFMYKIQNESYHTFFDGLLDKCDRDEIKERREKMKTQRNYSKDGNLVILSKDVCDWVVLVGLQHFNFLDPEGNVIDGDGFNVVGMYHIYMKNMNEATFGDKYEKFRNSIKMISDFVVKDNKVVKVTEEGGFEETEAVCKKDGIEILVLQGQSDEKKMGDQSKTEMVKDFCKEKKIEFILPDDKDEDSSLDVRLDVDGKCLYACYTGNEREEERKIWKFFGDNYLRSKVLSMNKKVLSMDTKMKDMDKKMEEGFDDVYTKMKEGFDDVYTKMKDMDKKMTVGFDNVDQKMDDGFERLSKQISGLGKRKASNEQTKGIENENDRLMKKFKK